MLHDGVLAVSPKSFASLVDQLTLDEQISLLAGAGFWGTVAIDRLGIPSIKVTDGPNGARGAGALASGTPAASFPVGISLASTWNLDLAREFGSALAAEVKTKGAQVALAPTVNIHRSPLGGRNFESFSEDPLLAGKIGAAIVAALQEQKIAATVKHYTGNESEFERATVNSVIPERALRELYLRPFEIVVREANPWGFMSAYNQVNGVFCCQNPRLLQTILRDEWGFNGFVMSDWVGTKTTVEAINAGLDLEMPGPTIQRGPKLRAAVDAGQVSRTAVRTAAENILTMIDRVDGGSNPASDKEEAVDLPETRALIRKAGAQGIVLLKNNGILPLNRSEIKSIAAVGPNADTAQIMGGGSSQINAHYRISPLQGMDLALGSSADVGYSKGCANERLLPVIPNEVKTDFYGDPDFGGEPVFSRDLPNGDDLWLGFIHPAVPMLQFSARATTTFTADRTDDYEFSVVCAGPTTVDVDGERVIDFQAPAVGGEFFGLLSPEIRGKVHLKAGQTVAVVAATAPGKFQTGIPVKALRLAAGRQTADDEVDEAIALAATSDVAVVYVGLSGEWDTEGFDRPDMDLPGRQNELVARVAAVNKNTVVVVQTGGPVHMPWLNDVAAVVEAWYPGQECGNAIADVLFGDVNPSGRLPASWPLRYEHNPSYQSYPGSRGAVEYTEGLFCGYRHYTSTKTPTLYPFGYGLTYSTFVYGDITVSADEINPGDTITVSVPVTNTSDREGTEVVQFYVHDPVSTLQRPVRELRGFARVTVEPGKTAQATCELNMRSFAFFEDQKQCWIAESGEFVIEAGASSEDIRARKSITLNADWIEAAADAWLSTHI